MDKTDIERRVKNIIAEQLNGFGAEKIRIDDRLELDLGADSLDILEITMSVEDEFHIEIEDENYRDLRTVRDIVDCVFDIVNK